MMLLVSYEYTSYLFLGSLNAQYFYKNGHIFFEISLQLNFH